MRRKGGKTREFMLAAPQRRRWTVQGIRCQQIGYRPDTPAQWLSDLQKVFPRFQLTNRGLCSDCEQLVPSNRTTPQAREPSLLPPANSEDRDTNGEVAA